MRFFISVVLVGTVAFEWSQMASWALAHAPREPVPTAAPAPEIARVAAS